MVGQGEYNKRYGEKDGDWYNVYEISRDDGEADNFVVKPAHEVQTSCLSLGVAGTSTAQGLVLGLLASSSAEVVVALGLLTLVRFETRGCSHVGLPGAGGGIAPDGGKLNHVVVHVVTGAALWQMHEPRVARREGMLPRGHRFFKRVSHRR